MADEVCPYCGPDCVVGYGMCHCGCGAATRVIPQNHRGGVRTPANKGQPYQYLQYHASRTRRRELPTQCPYCGPVCAVGYGRCHCGCGGPTGPATFRHAVRTLDGGSVMVRPGWRNRYVAGHQFRHTDPQRAHNRKVPAEAVPGIRQRYLDHEASAAELAAEFGVHLSTMEALLRLETYREQGIA